MSRIFTRVLLATIVMAAVSGLIRADEPNVSVVVGSLSVVEGGATDAVSPLKSPFGVDFDSQGSMLIVELEGGRVHCLSATGQFTTIAGDGGKSYEGDGGPAAKATFNGMHNVAVTPDGDVYIADSWNHCIRKIAADSGVISTCAGTGAAGFSGDGGPAAEATFNFIMCISLNTTNDALYVADLKNRRIRKIDLKTNLVDTVAGNGEKGVPEDDADATKSPLVDPRAVAVDSHGVVYILERGGHALRAVAPNGKIRTVAGTGKNGFHDGPALEAQFGSPKHVCVDDSDNVYIADDLNKAVRKYNPRSETVTTVVGRGHGTPAVELLHPHGVCFEQGALYVVDTGNDRILRADFRSSETWSRFRGPNGSGVICSVGLPDAIDAEGNLLWKADSGKGSSSPIVADGRLYLTSYEGNDRFTHCLDTNTGESLWKQTVEKVRDETASNPNSPATCTPVTDGENVVAFFPDSGLFCYSIDGAEKWRAEVGPFHSMHGITGSPVLVDNLVVLQVDQLRGSELSVYDLATGKLAWKVPRIDGLTGAYSTPSILATGGTSLIVTSGPQELAGYLAATGEKVWSVPGVSNAPVTVPIISAGRIISCEPMRTSTTPFNLLAALDADKDGKYTLEEAKRSIPSHRLLERIDNDHGNGDGVIEESEWNEAFGKYLNKGGLVAVDLPGDETASPEVRWTYRKSVPYIASPLVLDGILYVAQGGGIVTTIDPETGDVLHRGRLSQGAKQYYASPVAADGKIFLVDTEGKLTVVRAGSEWEELSTTSLGEPCYATPAICGGRIFVRTSKGLYCFGGRDG